jgi:hypothetical protein
MRKSGECKSADACGRAAEVKALAAAFKCGEPRAHFTCKYNYNQSAQNPSVDSVSRYSKPHGRATRHEKKHNSESANSESAVLVHKRGLTHAGAANDDGGTAGQDDLQRLPLAWCQLDILRSIQKRPCNVGSRLIQIARMRKR